MTATIILTASHIALLIGWSNFMRKAMHDGKSGQIVLSLCGCAWSAGFAIHHILQLVKP